MWQYGDFGTDAAISVPVSDGARVFVRSSVSGVSTLSAFDLEVGSRCGGAGAQCPPRWTATLPFPSEPQPIVAAGRVFVAGSDHGNWDVVGYDAAGVDGCSGSPRVCGPVWRAQWSGGVEFGGLGLTANGDRAQHRRVRGRRPVGRGRGEREPGTRHRALRVRGGDRPPRPPAASGDVAAGR